MQKPLNSFLLLLFLMLTNYTHSQNEATEKLINKTINTFFEGLHKGDTVLINKSISSTLKLQTIFVNKKGEDILKTETKKEFLHSISNKRKEDIWLEKLTSITIKIDGSLASVWAPYEFFFNNKLSHCGANSFQLFNNNGNWKIIYLVNTRRRENCNLL